MSAGDEVSTSEGELGSSPPTGICLNFILPLPPDDNKEDKRNLFWVVLVFCQACLKWPCQNQSDFDIFWWTTFWTSADMINTNGKHNLAMVSALEIYMPTILNFHSLEHFFCHFHTSCKWIDVKAQLVNKVHLRELTILVELPYFMMMPPSKHSSKLYCLTQGIMVIWWGQNNANSLKIIRKPV